MKQVFLQKFGIWRNVIDECDTFILAKYLDGVMVYVVKDGLQLVRLAP